MMRNQPNEIMLKGDKTKQIKVKMMQRTKRKQ